MSSVEMIALCAGFLICGGILGAVIMYVANLRRYHSDDVKKIMNQTARLDSNMMKVHENMRRMADKFDGFSDDMLAKEDNIVDDVNNWTDVSELLIRQKDVLDTLEKDTQKEQQMLEQFQSQMKDVGTEVEGILERLKLMI